jgi:polysaccharide biosynthesis/export protein
MAFTITAIEERKGARHMQMPKCLTCQLSFLQIGILSLVSLSLSAQELPSQKIGGASSFDTNPGLSGNDNAPGHQRTTSLSVVPEDFASLKLAPGFLLGMQVYDVPELTADFRVNNNGDVTVPMVGLLHVGGKTVTEVQSEIALRLRTGKIINDPHVTLNIEQYAGQNISVLGEVHNPGHLELLAPRNLSDVLALVGGETQYAGNVIEIRRQTNGSTTQMQVHYDQSKDDDPLKSFTVIPGDIITVRRAGIVYVFGGVNRPGGYVMQEGGTLNLSQALALAYGTSMQASVSSIRLLRKKSDGSMQEIPIPYKDITRGKVPPTVLQAEDVVYVPISKLKTVLTSSLLNSTAGAAMIFR